MMDNKVIQFPTNIRSISNGRLLVPSRLLDARKVKRLSQEELATLVGVTRQSISAYERGEKFPDSDVFQHLTAVLEQPVGYFTNPDAPLFGNTTARFYRKFGAETIRRNEACAVLSNWFVYTAKYLDDFINYPPVSLLEGMPGASSGRYTNEEIETLALNLRRHWGLGLGPISNVLALLESKGIVICKYEMDGENVEAFSFWNGKKPFIFMASEKEAGARIRYDLAHELGHLVLHKWVESSELENKDTLKIIENEANKFAAAFLLPTPSFPNEIYTTKLDAFIPLKQRWKVSIQVMMYRCRDLDIIDSDQFLNLYKQVSFRKWKKKEPLDDPSKIPLEQPRLLRQAMELLIDNARKHPDEIVNELRLNPSWLEIFCNLPKGVFKSPSAANFALSLK